MGLFSRLFGRVGGNVVGNVGTNPEKPKPINLDETAVVEFVIGGRTLRFDPFELIDELAFIDSRHNYRPGDALPAALLADVCKYAAGVLGVESVTRTQGVAFYSTVTAAVNAVADDIKKKVGRMPA